MDNCSSTSSVVEAPTCSSSSCAYDLLLNALFLIPISHYCIGFFVVYLVFLYNFFEIHFFEDVFSGFTGSPVKIVRNSSSDVYNNVVSKCRVLHGRYLATPWLASPHFQTLFLNFFGRPPSFSYRRQIFHASDGGTIALDWVLKSDVSGGPFQVDNSITKDDTTPIVVVVPGLTSDSSSAYIKHLAFNTAKRGWNIVVSNHRGLGGVAVTSDCFYNAGWTEDTRAVLNYLHQRYPKAPLFAVGTSIGANILVKYLGEHGENVPIAGAVAICSPWDLLIGDRFICRKTVQKLYDRALAIGLQGYAQLHQPRYARLADWDGIKKSRSIRDFDNYATCLVGKFETVDTYYRRCSSASYVGNVSVPLLCISALDDPLCTKEAIPWDECRGNKNIVLVTPKHGGHLAFFEGITASGLWWVRAIGEFLEVLHSSPYMHVQKKVPDFELHTLLESSIDQGPYVNVANGMVSASGNQHVINAEKDEIEVEAGSSDEANGKVLGLDKDIHKTDIHKTAQASREVTITKEMDQTDEDSPVMRCLNQLSRHSRRSIWLLAYIAFVTSWPTVGSALRILFKKKPKNVLSAGVLKK